MKKRSGHSIRRTAAMWLSYLLGTGMAPSVSSAETDSRQTERTTPPPDRCNDLPDQA